MKKTLFLLTLLGILVSPSLSFGYFDTSLKYGSRGTPVFELQDLMVHLGYLNVSPTGYFGVLTLNAVKEFQTANGLASDGYFGALSRAKASSILAEMVTSSEKAEEDEMVDETEENTEEKAKQDEEDDARDDNRPVRKSRATASGSSESNERLEKGELWIAGSSNSFQVTLANFTKDSTTLDITPPEGLVDSDKSNKKCSGKTCTEIHWFILEGQTHEEADELPDDRSYEFTIEVFGETYDVTLDRGDEKTIFKD